MDKTDITQVKQVMEMSLDDRLNGKGVNEYLAEGWILLSVHSVSVDGDYGPAQMAVYVLGRTGEPPR